MSTTFENKKKELQKVRNTLRDCFHKWKWVIFVGILTAISISFTVLVSLIFMGVDDKSIIVTNETIVGRLKTNDDRLQTYGMIQFVGYSLSI